MPSHFDSVYKVDGTTVLNPPTLNVRFQDLDNRLVGLEALNISWQDALRIVQDKVLAASEAVIAGLRDQLVEITQLQWLVAGSGTPLTLVQGSTLSLLVLPDDRTLFTPGPFGILSNADDSTNYAVIRTVSYDRTLGQFNFLVESLSGSAGPHANWQIAAVAGSTLAQMALLGAQQTASAQSASDAAAAHADRLAADADAASTASDRAAILAAVAAGPVTSVAGLTGNVTAAALKTALAIAAGDIGGLGGAATKNIGVTAGTVAAGDDARIVGAATATDLAVEVAARTALSAVVLTRAQIVAAAYGDPLNAF